MRGLNKLCIANVEEVAVAVRRPDAWDHYEFLPRGQQFSWVVQRRSIAVDSNIQAGLMEFVRGRVEWIFDYGLVDKIQKIWNPDYEPAPRARTAEPAPSEPGICYAPLEPAWFIGLTPTFQKSIKRVDKTLQGRILEVLVSI